jgi:2,4-didehydro-3-deoxy-L-rhamnonate hydrolase
VFLANVRERLAIFVDGQPVDVEQRSDGRFAADPAMIFERWSEFRDWAAGIGAEHGPGEAKTDPAEHLGPPSPRPSQVFGISLNYRDHATEADLDVPAVPSAFTKFPSCIVGSGAEVRLAGPTSDWEVELVVVIGRRARGVDASDAWDHVAGVTVGQDLSERTRQLAGPLPQFSLGKSFPGYGPTGPWLVTPDELPDRDDLALRCRLDGETVQDSRTSQLIFPVPELIAYLSSVVTLMPGDLIFTGTPAGVGFSRSPKRFLEPGQQIVSEIEGVGRLLVQIVAPAAEPADLEG